MATGGMDVEDPRIATEMNSLFEPDDNAEDDEDVEIEDMELGHVNHKVCTRIWVSVGKITRI